MSTQDVIRGLFALLFSGIIAWNVYSRSVEEDEPQPEDSKRQRYLPYGSGILLPLLILVLLVMGLVYYGPQEALRLTLSVCFTIFVQITLYYLLLLPALPLLRRHFSARACAALWILPNFLYVTQQQALAQSRPLVVVSASGALVWGVFWVWLAGALVFFLWKIIAHLRFRSKLLRGAQGALDPEILAVWEQELAAANVKKPKFRLVISPNTTTPLSVGLFQRTIRVVLPRRPYSKEELALVFRHELVHIGREDAWNKFFLLFCTALCWFNPLMWVAMKKSAEDLELSCDETVLLEADGDTRARYARLLLDTAGDAQGFTTCLSASASSLRYRLKSIVRPSKKWAGGLMLGLVFFVLCMSCGYAALAWDAGTGREIIYQSQDPQHYTLSYVTRQEDGETAYPKCTDPQALAAYLSQLPMEYLTGNYTFEEEERALFLLYEADGSVMGVTLWDHAAKVVPLDEEDRSSGYYLPQATDWAYLDSLLAFDPEG